MLCAVALGDSASGEGSPLFSSHAALWPHAENMRSTATVHYFDLGARPSIFSLSPPLSPEPAAAPCSPSRPSAAVLAQVEAYRTLADHGFAVGDNHAPFDDDDFMAQEELIRSGMDSLHVDASTGVTAAAGCESAPVAGPTTGHHTATCTSSTVTIPSSSASTTAQKNGSAEERAGQAETAAARANAQDPAQPAPRPSLASPSSLPSEESIPCASPTRPCLRMCISASPASSSSSPDSSVPASPTRKRLSWADQDGCELVAAMPFMRDDEPWRCARTGRRVPALLPSACMPLPLRLPIGNYDLLSGPGPRPAIVLEASLPAHDRDLMTLLGAQGVQLESVLVRAPLVFCTVRVLNVAFEKSVMLRMTKDNWVTHVDVAASYMPGSSDGRSDRFYASLSVTDQEAQAGVQFAVCYRTTDREFWDNRSGSNYTFVLARP